MVPDWFSGKCCPPWAHLLVAAALGVWVASAAGARWPPPPMPFPPRPRAQLLQQQLLGRVAAAQMSALDVTPEDFVIDQITAYLQQAQRAHDLQKSLQQQLPPPVQEDEDRYEDIFEEEGVLPSPREVAKEIFRERQGPGFTYRFPVSVEQSSKAFAVNPSDPKYYTPSAIGRNGNNVATWESMGENEVGGSEGGGASEKARQPLLLHDERFPMVKVVVTTTGTDAPPVQDVEEIIPKAAGEADKSNLRMSHETADVEPGGGATGGSISPDQMKRERPEKVPLNFGSDAYITAIISGCIAAAAVGVIAFAIFWYRLQRNAKAAADVEYPAYGVTGPNQEVSAVAAAAAASSAASPTPLATGGSTSPLAAGDRRLAQSAQMYHYQHQKQQIIAMESRATNERRGSVSEVDSEEENEEGDYTVYECPGLAPTGEMEVKNPLFHDDPTPATPSGCSNGRDQRGNGGSKP